MKNKTRQRLEFWNTFLPELIPLLAIIGFAILFAAMFQAAGVMDFSGLFSW